MSEIRTNRDRITVALAGFLVLIGTLTFAVAGDAPHMLIMVLAGVGGALFLKHPLARTSRTLVYSSVLVLIITVLQDQILPVDPDKFFLGAVALFCPLLLYTAVALLYFADDESTYGALIAAMLFATMAAGSRMLWGTDRETVSWLGGVSTGYHVFYATMVALEFGTMLILLGRIEHRRIFRRPGGRPWLWRLALTAAAVVLVAGSVVGLRVAARVYEQMVTRMFGHFLQSYFMRRFNWVIFPEDVDLWRTVPFTVAQNREIVLRARSPVSPGYLRGRAYPFYARGHWTASRKEVRSLASREAGGRLAYSIYSRTFPDSVAGGEGGSVEAASYWADLLVANHFRSDVLLAGGGATEFALTTRNLSEDRDGSLIPHGWDRRAGYSYRFQPDMAYPAPAPPESARYLEVPPDLKPQLQALLKEIPESASPLPVAERVDQVCRLLQMRCAYALNVQRSRRRDPVQQFLFEQRRGHCELFAAAAVLLLRTQGLPARYVTGFVCVEPHPSGLYWLARLRDAHAWAEVWDAAAGRWILVEATPGNGVPDGSPGFGLWTAWLDRGFYALQSVYMWLKRGYLAESVLGSLKRIGEIGGQLVRQPWSGGLLALIAGVGWAAWRRVRRRRRENDPLLPDPRRRLCREWRTFEQGLARRGWRREPAWTLREFGRRSGWLPPISEAESGTPAAELAKLVHDYERLRYRAGLPDPAELAAMGARFRQARRRLQKRDQ